jgi:succinate-semialdehyde dehydrogenase/glutarate-semialdehyde dehydrogenase
MARISSDPVNTCSISFDDPAFDETRFAQQVADRLDVGMVGLNTIIRSSPELPFGGVKSSGIGRELGRFGLDEFANKKLVRLA